MSLKPVLLVTFIGLMGCGDDSSPVPPIDAGPVVCPTLDPLESTVTYNCPAFPPGETGGACTSDAACTPPTTPDADDFTACFLPGGPLKPPPKFPAEGYCTTLNQCTDNTQCGTSGECVTVVTATSSVQFCLGACCSNGDCPQGMLCQENIEGNQFFDSGVKACIPGNPEARDGQACESIGDCNVNSNCRFTGLDYPKGYCRTQGCTVGDDTTCAGGGTCVASWDPLILGNVCVQTCDSTSECNHCRTEDGYRCMNVPGVGDICEHPKVGDACATNTDCGTGEVGAMICDTTKPDGTCTAVCSDIPAADGPNYNLSRAGCSDRSLCFDPDINTTGNAYCAVECTVQADCRTGYTCTTQGTGTRNKVCTAN